MWKAFLIYEKMHKYLPYLRRLLFIYDFATAPFSIYEENFLIAANVGHSPTTGTFDVARSSDVSKSRDSTTGTPATP
jgi:hypothetical protein